MIQRSNLRSAHGLAALFGAVMIAACGGGDDPEGTGAQAPAPVPAPAANTPPPPPPPAPAADTAFASPMNTTDTTEAGKIDTYNFAEKGNEQVPGPLTFGGGAISYSATLGAAQGWAGTAVRYYAPNNTGNAPVSAFDASSFTKIKIQLKSTTDALLQIKLQPSPVSADGCTATASAVVSSTLTELVIDLNQASFPLPGHCATGTAIDAVKAGLYAIDVVNVGVSAGVHDLTVGTVKLSK